MTNDEDKILFKEFLQQVGLEKIDFYPQTKYGQHMGIFDFLQSFRYFLKQKEKSNTPPETHLPH